jgi:hypothetical protein
MNEFLDLFRTQYNTQEEIQEYLDNPGSRSIFVMTIDSSLSMEPAKLNCGIETLVSTL